MQKKLLKYGKKCMIKNKIDNLNYNSGISINYTNNKIDIKGIKKLFEFNCIYIFLNKIIYIYNNIDKIY